MLSQTYSLKRKYKIYGLAEQDIHLTRQEIGMV